MENVINLLLNKPIYIQDVGFIYQPTLNDILDIGSEHYNNMLLPFNITTDMFSVLNNDKTDFKALDLILMDFYSNKSILFSENRIHYFYLLIQALEYFTKNKVEFNKDLSTFIIGDNQDFVNRDNFDNLVDVILQINGREKPVMEKEPEFKSERQKRLWLKLQEGRKRKAQKDGVNLATIIKTVMFGGKSYISDKQIGNMTMWQLTEAYKTILQIDSYNSNFDLYLAGAESKNLDLVHWSEKIKIQ